MRNLKYLFIGILTLWVSTMSAQSAALNVALKFQIGNPGSTGTNPTFTMSGFVSDDLGRWDATNVQVGDSLYAINGSDLAVCVVTTINSAAGNSLNITVTCNDPLVGGIDAGQAAIVHPTSEYKFPTYISGLRDDLRSMIMNRLTQRIDEGVRNAQEVAFTLGTGIPASTVATVQGYRLAKNSMGDGDLYEWNGTAWVISGGSGSSFQPCVDTINITGITPTPVLGSGMVRVSGGWDNISGFVTTKSPDGVVVYISGSTAVIATCGSYNTSLAAGNYYADSISTSGFTTTTPTGNIRPLGHVTQSVFTVSSLGTVFTSGGGVSGGTINTAGLIDGDGSSGDPVRLIAGTQKNQVMSWDTVGIDQWKIGPVPDLYSRTLYVPRPTDSIPMASFDGRYMTTVADVRDDQVENYPAYIDSVNVHQKQSYFAKADLSIVDGSYQWDLDEAQVAQVSPTAANTAFDTPLNQKPGGKYTLIVKQDAIGGRVLSFSDAYMLNTTIPTTPLSVTTIEFVSDGIKMYGDVRVHTNTLDYDLINAYSDSLDFFILPHFASLAGRTLNGRYTSVTGAGQNVFDYWDLSKNVNRFITQAGNIGFEKDGLYYCYNFPNGPWLDLVEGYKYIPAKLGSFSYVLKVKKASSASNRLFSNKGNGAASNGAVDLSINSSGFIEFSTWNAAGTLTNTITSTTALTNGVWATIVIKCNGSNISLFVDNGVTSSTTTAAFTPDATITTAQRSLKIGEYGGAGVPLNGKIAMVLGFNRQISTTLENRLKEWIPELNTGSASSVTSENPTSPRDIKGLAVWYDFSDASTLFTDAAKTTNVTTNGDQIHTVANKVQSIQNRDGIRGSATGDYTTNDLNAKSVVTLNSSDYYDFSQALAGLSNWTLFAVYKSSDTTRMNTIVEGGSNNVIITTVPQLSSGKLTINYGQVHATLYPPSKFRDDYQNRFQEFSTYTNKLGWNELEVSKRNDTYSISANGKYLFSTKDTSITFQLLRISAATSSISLVGKYAEFLFYPMYLDNAKRDYVRRYLKSKWGLNVEGTINIKPDADSRVISTSLYEDRDYNTFPDAIIVNDTIHVTWNSQQEHNFVINDHDAVLYRRFDKKGNPIGAVETVAVDKELSPNLDMQGGYPCVLPNGRIAFSYVSYQFGNDTVESYIRIRESNGTYGPLKRIAHPYTIGVARLVCQQLVYTNNALYAFGYGRISGAVNYDIHGYKSLDFGNTWTQVMTLEGETLGGLDPEEVKVRHLSNGEWLMLIRVDQNYSIYSLRTTNIDNWTNNFTYCFRGLSMPGFCETDQRVLIATVRHFNTSTESSYEPVYVRSYDYGHTWTAPTKYEEYKNKTVGGQQMYAAPVDLGKSKVGIFTGICTGWVGSNGFASEIYYKIIKY